MIVTCPDCSTTFNFPDEHIRENTKLRCSVCKRVFVVPDPDLEPLDFDLDIDFGGSSKSSKRKSKSKIGCLAKLLFLVVLLGAIGGGVYFYKPDLIKPYIPASVLSFIENILADSATDEDSDTAERIKSIVLRDVRHYDFNNEKEGAIAVIEGKVVNGFDMPRELIRVEASLYDKDGKALVVKQQLAGTSVSLFQLQVLGEGELEKALSSKIDILTNNTNVMPGNEVPFMLVFYNPPDTAVEFGVKVADAKIPPNPTP